MTSIGWGQSPWFPTREGTFFGQIMVTNAGNNLDAYYCNGPGTDKNVVPGRLGFNQGSVPVLRRVADVGRLRRQVRQLAHGAQHGRLRRQRRRRRRDAVQAERHDVELPDHRVARPDLPGRGRPGRRVDQRHRQRLHPAGRRAALGRRAASASTPASAARRARTAASIIVDDTNGMGKRVGYFNGPSKGLKFSGVNVACAGTANLTVYTTNGDAIGTTNRHLSFIVNGGAPQDVAFHGRQRLDAPGRPGRHALGLQRGHEQHHLRDRDGLDRRARRRLDRDHQHGRRLRRGVGHGHVRPSRSGSRRRT